MTANAPQPSSIPSSAPDPDAFPEELRLRAEVAGTTWQLARSGSLEELWERMDQNDFEADERIPYWAELWPAAIALARFMAAQGELIADHRCLEAGCGLGLTAMVAASLGARVAAMDYEPEAIASARAGALANAQLLTAGRTPGWLVADWRTPPFKPQAFDHIWGADILYETRFFKPVADLITAHLAPGGVAWLAQPDRQVTRPFWELIVSRRFEHRIVSEEAIPHGPTRMTVQIHELRRAASSRART